ncbi:MAG: hypothetical protein IH955_04335 [Chloroflexi bacterium]|nr:hypothetical protein [Chloroflexota bacterium]
MDRHFSYVDVDGHILEPPGMWREYIEPEYRDRSVKIDLDGQMPEGDMGEVMEFLSDLV